MEQAKEKTLRFLKSIGIENTDDFDFVFKNIIKSDIDKNYFSFCIEKETGWDYRTFEQFLNGLNNITTYKYQFIFNYVEDIKNNKLKDFINDWFFNTKHERSPFEIKFGENNEIIFSVNNNEDKEKIESSLDDLKSLFSFINYNFSFNVYNISKQEKITQDYKPVEIVKNENQQVDIKEDIKRSEEELLSLLKENYELMLEERRKHELFKNGEYIPCKIIQIDSNSGLVDINGKVFEVTFRDTKTGKLICKVGLYDGSKSIYCTIFSGKTYDRETLLEIKVGMNLRIKGRVDLDKFSKDGLVVIASHFYVLPNDLIREDLCEEKRVELHLHTRMSDMDGLGFFNDYATLAKHMGHKAIAITDHGNVQGFPDAQAVCKKNGLKGLYGSELYLIDDKFHPTINARGSDLAKSTYVCVDTETTGLSIKYDRITEFGAVKIVNGVVTDRIDILINPEIPIPKLLQEKTNITDEMVKDAPTIKEALPKILEFINGSIMVTHNLEFDFGMINQAMIDNGFGKLEVESIDTLPLSRFLFPDSARHSLGSLANRYDVEYDEESAHRADYDAKVLSNIWIEMLDELIKKHNFKNTNQLVELDIDNRVLAHYRNCYHVIVLCKNKAGVKELYQIISESHINTIGNFPFVKRSFLDSHREHLFVSSACFNGEVFQNAMLRDDVKLREAIKYYDYIELQPLANYCFLINNNNIFSEERLKEIIKNIVKISNEEGKLICATGDCHYVNPEDKEFRDVIIHATQVGGKFHPLNINPYNKPNIPYCENPDQHYRSTQEMLDAFDWLGKDNAYNFVIKNTNKIADQIDEIIPVVLDTHNPYIEHSEELLTEYVYKNAKNLYGDDLHPIIKERLERELKGIIDNGYATLYWIAHLLVKKANEDGQSVGSRGSVGSSFIATMADITEVNPLPPHYRCPNCKHVEFYDDDPQASGFDLPEKNCPHCGTKMVSDGQSIPFQTFLGFHADKTPDIDLNFATDYQATAHNYTKVLLGEKNVYRAGTISAVQFKTAYGYVCTYLKEVLGKDEEYISHNGADIARLSYGCVEVKRTTGQHPAGIVVVPKEYVIEDFTPVQYPADDTTNAWLTTHFDFTSMHDTLLKLDILGHLDPQSIKMMCDLMKININDIPMNDPEVLSLFTSDKALNMSHEYLPVDNGSRGLPEFGTDFVRQVLRESQPKTFRDLVIISGLTHGTDVWNNNARDLILYDHKTLQEVIGCRDDIMVYLMQKGLENNSAFNIMETVRKKEKQLNNEQINEMLEHNVPEYYIESCKKIKYMFPKGHATAYVMMAVRVGYFKIHHPLAFYATFFSLRCDDYDIEAMVGGIEAVYNRLHELYVRRESKNPEDKLSNKESSIISTLEVALEFYERGFKFTNIDIEKSEASNFVIDYENKSLIPPFKTIDGVGVAASETVVAARKERPFSSKQDFKARSGLNQTNIKKLESLKCLNKLNDTEQMTLFDFDF